MGARNQNRRGQPNRSRYERHPTYRNGREVVIPNPTGVYLAILEELANYRTLNAPLLGGLLGLDPHHIRNCLADLFAPANQYIDLYNQRDGTQQRWLGLAGSNFFMLNANGTEILRQHHAVTPVIEGKARDFPHEIGIHRSVGSIDIGLRREKRHRIVRSDEIKRHPNFAAANEEHPFSIRVERDYTFPNGRKDSFNHVFRPDDFLGIRYDNGELPFFYFEYENKNTIDSNSFNDISFLMKFLALQYIIGRGLCEERWGIPREQLKALFAAPTEAHVENMKAVVDRETYSKGCDWIAFAVVPTLVQTLSITPMPELYGRWQRVERPDLDLREVPEPEPEEDEDETGRTRRGNAARAGRR